MGWLHSEHTCFFLINEVAMTGVVTLSPFVVVVVEKQ